MRVDAGGVALWVEDLGRKSAAAPVVMLHGFTGSSASWRVVGPALATRGRVLLPDLVGHGRSDAPDERRAYRVDACVSQLLSAMDALGVPRADWIGYSLGGRLAMALALAAPERVRRLVLESCSPGIADTAEREARRARDEALADELLREGVPAFLDRWMGQPLFATQARLGPAWLAQERALRLGSTPLGLANSLRGMGQGALDPLSDRLGQLRAPTLLVSGALDARYTALMASMAAAMPYARHLMVPDAGHAVHAEQPAEFLAAVRDFLHREAV